MHQHHWALFCQKTMETFLFQYSSIVIKAEITVLIVWTWKLEIHMTKEMLINRKQLLQQNISVCFTYNVLNIVVSDYFICT